MSITNWKLYKLVMASALGVLLLLAFAASGFAPSARANETQSGHAFAHLRHTPYGTAVLRWDPKTENLRVTIRLIGLAPNSTHPAHIHLGDCDDNGPILYPLNNVVANAAGDAHVTTVIPDVENGIPSSGWYVNVHNGPTLATFAQAIPIACGDVHNSDTSKKDVQTVTTFLGATTAPDQMAHGLARLSLKNETLTVTVTVRGLVPGSVHPAHIHAGSCQSQIPGIIVYPLNNVVADANGNATSVTVINDVESIPESGWYVNVHRSTDLSTQTGFDPITCGNVEDEG
jgi:quercetin dioxygenase-like cupin family protein